MLSIAGRLGQIARSSRFNSTMTYKSPYQSIRDTLDYAYHSKPSEHRIQCEDKFITTHLTKPYTCRPEPQLLFTAGAMGAGKSHFLSTLPYKYVLIDPDEIASSMPPFESSDISFRPAEQVEEVEGTRARHEARLITEILLQAAMQRRADVVLDGSLRSYQWYLQNIPQLRHKHPDYRVDLVHIHCPLPEVLKRAHKRALKTGRQVPNTLIERSWKDSRRAISVLGRKKLVDRVHMIDSSGSSPVRIYDSNKDPDWPSRGVPNDISPVDGVVTMPLVENGDDISEGKRMCKL